MIPILLAVLLLTLAFLHGVFASGFVPILHDHATEHAALAFALYFGGQVLGQLLIAVSAPLRRPRWAFALYEAFFGVSLIAMGIWFAWLPWSLLAGRLFEGFFGGLTLPLLFQCVATMHHLGSPERRMALFNSTFAIGFVAGPPAVAWMQGALGPPALLEVFGGVFVASVPALALLMPAPPAENDQAATPHGGWFDTFYLLFLGKTAYGFILPFVTHVVASRLPIPVSVIMLLMSAVFIAGQVLGGPILGRWPKVPWGLALPLTMAASLVTLVVPSLAWLIFVGGFIHSVLMLKALMGFTQIPASARQFALLSSLSDPGLVVGASIAAFGNWGIGALALLCVIPAVRRRFRS